LGGTGDPYGDDEGYEGEHDSEHDGEDVEGEHDSEHFEDETAEAQQLRKEAKKDRKRKRDPM